MLSDEEKEAIEGIKKDDEYYDILENIKQNKYNMWNAEKLMRDTTTGDYTEYEIAQSIVYFVNLIEKQSKEIEHQKEKRENQKQELAILNAKQIEFNKLVNTVNSYKGQFKRQQKEIEDLKEKNKNLNWYFENQKDNFVHKDKIKAKIEELNKDFKEYENGQEWEIQDEIRGQIEVLQSLLEKE